MPEATEVLIVGAGPTGLMLAGDLAAAGVSVTVLERRAQESLLTRAFAVHARTLELLDARGVADELVTRGVRIGTLQMIGDAQLDLKRLPSRFPYMLLTPQHETEAVLAKRAGALGADVRLGAEVTGLRQDADGVSVSVRRFDGTVHTWRARYVVGADGMNSVVRRALGFPFPGRAALRSVMLADVRLNVPQGMPLANAVRDGIAFVSPLGDGWHRVVAWDRAKQLPVEAPLDLEDVRTITRKALGTDFGMHDPRWLSRFQTDERQAPRYRLDRVLLAGDAAHVHSPAGGQGMNTGLQDAANLAWRLAAVVRGRAPEELLDGYQTERHPIGRKVIRDSGRMMRLALIHTPVLRTAMNLASRAAAALPPLADRLAAEATGISIAYPAPRGAHPYTGRRAPDLRLAPGAGTARRLYEALRACRFVLVGRCPEVTGWGERLITVAPASPRGPALLLVRPDGYVAWAADDHDQDALLTALTRWVGPREGVASA
ncbi:FAD-dependent monooxygenase [Streptomyces sp. Go-475]|uniref:FAD-dependent monooxygenase n=1 Tax=Streptomyces sp. Go-475 TaxID=2072505 RepID=UPI000DEFC961|nr:FAD-dependent monooxygenase [Streptomyces sp. Go-475]AXE87010.1 Pentachlorophenol 4-monooxygenase [Streptomyces sp. Go-475]